MIPHINSYFNYFKWYPLAFLSQFFFLSNRMACTQRNGWPFKFKQTWKQSALSMWKKSDTCYMWFVFVFFFCFICVRNNWLFCQFIVVYLNCSRLFALDFFLVLVIKNICLYFVTMFFITWSHETWQIVTEFRFRKLSLLIKIEKCVRENKNRHIIVFWIALDSVVGCINKMSFFCMT